MVRSLPWLLVLLTACTPFTAADGPSDAASGDAAGDGGVGDAATRERYSDVVLADGPLQYYRFNDEPSAARDEVKGTPASLVGTAPARSDGAIASQPDGSYDFAASAGVIRPPTPTLTGSRPFTFELWIWLVAGGVNADFRHAFQVGDGSGATRDSVGLYVNSNTVEGLVLERYVGGGKQVARVQPPKPSMWHHVVASYDGNRLLLYVDGLLTSTPDARAWSGALMQPMSVGAKGSTVGASAWPGRIDELAIYDKALAPDRVKKHFDVGSAAP